MVPTPSPTPPIYVLPAVHIAPPLYVPVILQAGCTSCDCGCDECCPTDPCECDVDDCHNPCALEEAESPDFLSASTALAKGVAGLQRMINGGDDYTSTSFDVPHEATSLSEEAAEIASLRGKVLADRKALLRRPRKRSSNGAATSSGILMAAIDDLKRELEPPGDMEEE